MAHAYSDMVEASTSYDNTTPNRYICKTADALATVVAADYFLPSLSAGRPLKVNDIIDVVSDTGGNPVASKLRVTSVTSNTAISVEQVEADSVWITAELTDVSTASSTWLAFPFDGYIRGFKTILHGAIATADAAVGLEIGGTDVTGGQVTIANSGSAAGDVDSTTCTAANTGTAGTAVEIDTDGASTNTISVTCMVEFVPA
jgi:hypothetical protein